MYDMKCQTQQLFHSVILCDVPIARDEHMMLIRSVKGEERRLLFEHGQLIIKQKHTI